MDARAQARRKIEIELREAVQGDTLRPYYQPLVDLASGRITGFEALVRWPHPERGMISPAEFIPVAEETGLINAVGGLVLRRACADAAQWPDDVHVAVNLSPLQFRVGNLLQLVIDALKQTGLPARRLELEITETLLLEKSSEVLATLHALRALGVRISMDDFGTGYSSPELSAQLSVRQDQDRPVLRARPRLQPGLRRRSCVRSSASARASASPSRRKASRPRPKSSACAGRAATRGRASCSAARGPMRRSSAC